MSDYQHAMTQKARSGPSERAIPGTVEAASIGYLTSLEYQALASVTRDVRRRAIDRFRTKYGSQPIKDLEAHHIKKMMAEMISKPNAANTLRDTIHWLMMYSIEQGWRKDDPTRDIKKIGVKSEGFHSWTEEELSQYEAFWPIGTKQRLAFDLLLWTGQRSGDVRLMNRANLVGNALRVRQSKTAAVVVVPIAPQLRTSLETVPAEQIQFLLAKGGKPFSAKGFSNFVVWAAEKAGLSNCTAHGLRKAAATRLAEFGCTDHEIMSITGHKTLQEVQRYTRAARLERLATTAMDKMVSGLDARRAGAEVKPPEPDEGSKQG